MPQQPTCEAITRKGLPCPTHASPGSIYCHVHNPDLQCGATKRNGERCNVATGGVRCKYHRDRGTDGQLRLV